MSRYKPYPASKESGVTALGKVPSHWNVERLKNFAHVALSNVDKKTLEGEESIRLCNYVDVYYNDRIGSDLDFMPATATKQQVARFALRAGDVLITKDSESWDDIAVPAVVEQDLPGVLCGYHLALIRPGAGCDGRYLARAFAAAGPRHQFRVAAKGITRFGLSGDDIQTAVFPLPPADEQRAIAEFLDRETAKIDALVARKERLIELVAERRAAFISRAVTRGLEPSVPMRDAGVEWLGQIPAHWNASKIKRLFRQAKRQGHEDLTVLSVYRDLGVIQKSSRDDNFNKTPEDLSVYQLVNAGDLAIIKMKAWQGSLGVSALSGITSPDYLVYTPHHSENARFLHHYLRSGLLADVYLSISNGIRPNQWRLEPSRFEDLCVFLPSPSEQAMIALQVDRETERIDSIASVLVSAIERLKGLRVALVSAAVTGEIDVRGEVV